MYSVFTVIFDDMMQAEEERLNLRRCPRENLDVARMVSVERDTKGGVLLHHAHALTASGATVGGLWGGVVGLLLLNPLLGATAGAGVGAGLGLIGDAGIHARFLHHVGEHLRPGTSALFFFAPTRHANCMETDLATLYPQCPRFSAPLTAKGEEELQEFVNSTVAA